MLRLSLGSVSAADQNFINGATGNIGSPGCKDYLTLYSSWLRAS